MMIGPERTGTITQVSLEPHQRPVADLFERLQLDPAAGGGCRRSQVPRIGLRPAEQVTQVRALALKFRPGLKQPVVVTSRQELAMVLGNGLGAMPQDCVGVAGRRRRPRSPALRVE